MYIHYPTKGRQICLWLHGTSQTGKTSWARLIGNHYMIRGDFDGEHFHENVDYYVLDDKRPEDILYNELISGTEFNYNGKYCRIMTYQGGAEFGKEGIPVIWTSNFHPWDQTDKRKVNAKKVDIEWLQDNVILVDVGRQDMMLSPDEEDIIYEPAQLSIPYKWNSIVANYNEKKLRLFMRVIEAMCNGP